MNQPPYTQPICDKYGNVVMMLRSGMPADTMKTGRLQQKQFTTAKTEKEQQLQLDNTGTINTNKQYWFDEPVLTEFKITTAKPHLNSLTSFNKRHTTSSR